MSWVLYRRGSPIETSPLSFYDAVEVIQRYCYERNLWVGQNDWIVRIVENRILAYRDELDIERPIMEARNEVFL